MNINRRKLTPTISSLIICIFTCDIIGVPPRQIPSEHYLEYTGVIKNVG